MAIAVCDNRCPVKEAPPLHCKTGVSPTTEHAHVLYHPGVACQHANAELGCAQYDMHLRDRNLNCMSLMWWGRC